MEGSARTKKQRTAVGSLGWLTESSIMPKKHKAIEGVGASSILELKAQLYKSQEEAKKSKDLNPDIEFHRAKKKPLPHDSFSLKNSGVESRAHKDKLELKALNDGSASYAALEKKAELYNKLVRGELPDEEEKEKYCVDFFRKSIEEDQAEHLPPSSNTFSERVPEDENDDNTDMLFSAKPVEPAMVGVDNDEHKRFVREVHEEVNKAREKASTLKLRRQEQATARREKLRQAYLKKRLETLKTAAAAAKTNDS